MGEFKLVRRTNTPEFRAEKAEALVAVRERQIAGDLKAIDDLTARAEKAEARVKELEARVKELEAQADEDKFYMQTSDANTERLVLEIERLEKELAFWKRKSASCAWCNGNVEAGDHAECCPVKRVQRLEEERDELKALLNARDEYQEGGFA